MVFTGLRDNGPDGDWKTYDQLNAGSVVSAVLSGASVLTSSFSATSVSGTTLNSTTAVTNTVKYNIGSPYYQGQTITAVAQVIISGGMFVAAGSDELGLRVTVATAGQQAPIGICTADVASGGTATILINGVCYAKAAENIAAGNRVAMGSGAKLNTVAPIATGSAAGAGATVLNDTVIGYALLPAASGGTAVIRLI